MVKEAQSKIKAVVVVFIIPGAGKREKMKTMISNIYLIKIIA